MKINNKMLLYIYIAFFIYPYIFISESCN